MLRIPRAAVQGVDYQAVQIDLSEKPSFYRRVNSAGLVPAISSVGSVVTESLDIVRWIDNTLEGPRLAPADAVQRQDMDALISTASRLISAGFDLLAGRNCRCIQETHQVATQQAA